MMPAFVRGQRPRDVVYVELDVSGFTLPAMLIWRNRDVSDSPGSVISLARDCVS